CEATVPRTAAMGLGHWRNRVHRALWLAALRRSRGMSRRSGDDAGRFRLRPGAPKQRGDAFISKVLRQATKAANATGGTRGKAPGSRLGRGHVAARFTRQSLSANSARAPGKVRPGLLKQAGARPTVTPQRHLRGER